jgi:hypothetical protein
MMVAGLPKTGMEACSTAYHKSAGFDRQSVCQQDRFSNGKTCKSIKSQIQLFLFTFFPD